MDYLDDKIEIAFKDFDVDQNERISLEEFKNFVLNDEEIIRILLSYDIINSEELGLNISGDK